MTKGDIYIIILTDGRYRPAVGQFRPSVTEESMARISKEYDERLNELLDTAQQLFFQKGYHNTSVNDIIEAVGIAKGTFYHYFKTKDELLDRLVERFANQFQVEIDNVFERGDLDAMGKFNALMDLGRAIKTKNLDLMKMLIKAMYNEDNLILRYKILRSRVKMMIPKFAGIIEQGKAEGTFSVDYPLEVSELLYTMGLNVNESVGELLLSLPDNPDNMDKIDRKLHAYERAIERILGIRENSFTVGNREFIEMFRIDTDGNKEK